MARLLSRRAFLVAGAGLTFAFTVDGLGRGRRAHAQTKTLAPNVWVTIATDGTITIVSPAVEMGQGVMTGMPILVAEELDADWAKVKVIQAPVDRAYGNPGLGGLQLTGSSRTTSGYFMPLRLAGAQARRVLLDAVAAEWKVPVAELSTAPSVVVHKASGRRVGYGEIVQFATLPAELPKVTAADLKKTGEFRLIGKNLPRVDLPEKVTGAAKFGIDAEVPGMLYATVLRAPWPKAVLERVDDAATLAVPGVMRTVLLPGGVGVIGSGYEAVQKGKAALKASWPRHGAEAERYDSAKVLGEYAAAVVGSDRSSLHVLRRGNFARAFPKAPRTFTGLYLSDHVYHATMEPMTALASVSPDGSSCEIWAPTQAPASHQAAAAFVLRIEPAQVKVHPMLVGGGFGRKLEQDFVIDAVLLSKAARKPVKVIWSREDDVKHDKLRPLTAQYIQAGLDEYGNLSTWRYRIASASIDARFNLAAYEATRGKDVAVMEGHELSYSVVHQLHEYLREERGLDVGLWRSVGAGYTKFAIESFIDEIARAQRIDPFGFRRRLLAHNPRAKAVVEAATRMADWGKKRRGRALGMAMSDSWRSYIASVAEVSVDRATGRIQVHNIWSAVDPGLVILPDNVIAQIEGATVFGLSAALQERITVERGIVQQSNFHDYPILRMADVPDIHVKVVATDNAPGGIGEVGLPPVAPAIANAVAALTGARVRRLPMLPEYVLAALEG